MPKVLLTASFVRSVQCPVDKRKVDFFDVQHPGFLLEVRSSGGKTFYQRYRTSHGVERQYKIGPASIITLQKARRKAKNVAAAAALGDDPQHERSILRSTPRFGDFLMDTYIPFARSNKRSWRTDLAIVRTHLRPHLGRLSMDEVTPAAILKLLQTMQAAGYASGTTNRVLILLRHTFNLARQWETPGVSTNPTAGLKTAPDVQRERFLSFEEIGRLQAALNSDENQVAAAAIKLLLLTGARRNEVTYARWEYVDWVKATLKVPISKTGKPRWIKLNGAAVEVLRAVESRKGPSPFVFPSPLTGRPSPSLHFPWRRIKRRAGLEGVRLHDLRHTFASIVVNERRSLYEAQRLLGHTHAKATQRYAHLTDETLSDAAEVVSAKIGSMKG